MSDSIRLDDLKVDAANLYKEEVFSDLRVATIRRLTPVRADGSTDESRASERFPVSIALSSVGEGSAALAHA